MKHTFTIFIYSFFTFSTSNNFIVLDMKSSKYRSSCPEVFLKKRVLKICSKFEGEHPCRSVISLKLFRNFIEIALRHECSPINMLHIFRTPIPANISGWLLLKITSCHYSKYNHLFYLIYL